MNEQEFKERTKRVGLEVIRLIEGLPKGHTADVMGRQLLRSATSIGANYRAACRGKSGSDLLNKLGTVEEETDETLYWLELLAETKIVPASRVASLMSDAEEVLAMVVASIKTLRLRALLRDRQSKIQNPKSKMRNGS